MDHEELRRLRKEAKTLEDGAAFFRLKEAEAEAGDQVAQAFIDGYNEWGKRKELGPNEADMFLFGVQYVAELSDRYLTFTTDLFLATQPPDDDDESDDDDR